MKLKEEKPATNTRHVCVCVCVSVYVRACMAETVSKRKRVYVCVQCKVLRDSLKFFPQMVRQNRW